MTLRYLFGPVSRSFADQCLHQARADKHCLAFNSEGDVDLTIGFGDTWEEISKHFPADWQPDFVALYLPYTNIPLSLWDAPLPRVALASDWNLLWHSHRHWLPGAAVALADAMGTEVISREGHPQVWQANLNGCDRDFLGAAPAEGGRDIDILFVGNLNPAVQRERMPWMRRLAALSGRWRVLIQTGVFGDSYRRLLARAKIVFNFSPQGNCGRRAFESAAAGALLFQEASNRELHAYFEDRKECVYYEPDNLEQLLEHYLVHEEVRQAIAKAGWQKVQSFGFESLWHELLVRLEAAWPSLKQHMGFSNPPGSMDHLLARCWQALGSSRFEDLMLIRDLEKELGNQPHSALLHNALGSILSRQAKIELPGQTVGEMAIDCFRRAVEYQPDFVLARLNLAEALDAAGRQPAAIDAARQGLDVLRRDQRLDLSSCEGTLFFRGFDSFRVEWERKSWENAGRRDEEMAAKHRLLEWRLQQLLADWNGDLPSHYEAVLLEPGVDGSRLSLGKALLRSGRSKEAVLHLRQALSANPLDRDAARIYQQALGAAQDIDGQKNHIEERRNIAKAVPQLAPAEPWFWTPRPQGNELVSIIILCCNQLEYTRLCLESLLRYSRPPYELILVDNGSTDGTADYLNQIRRRIGPAHVEVIRNASNLGFAAGCNQGLARAKGEYIIFLNNDTVLTQGWLEGLVKWALLDWPTVGLGGPVTNGAPEPQGIPVDYTELTGLEDFAARRRRAFANQKLDVKRLTGFCLLARREMLDRIGKMDERFGIGFFEDDDLCFRAREAGYRMVVGLDVYIHHFGNRTFQSLGIDPRDKLTENFALFKSKWGQEQVAGYHMPPEPSPAPAEAPAPPPPAPPLIQIEGKPRVSLCMIVKNEEHHLPDCLRSIDGLFYEKIIVDTGSADGTRDIARQFGARVFDFPWVDSFSRARNESLGHATGHWIMWLDADDRLDQDNRGRLADLLSRLGSGLDAYAMKVRSALDETKNSYRLLDQVRIFRNLPEIRWDYRIHEQILPAVNKIGGGVRWVDITVDHVGYQDTSARRGKLDRNLRLLELDEAERPDDSFSLFNLGWTLLDLGRATEALPRLERSLKHSAPHSSILRKIHHLLALTHRHLGNLDESLAACRVGLERFPDDGEILLEEGLLLRDRREWEKAEQSWLRLLNTRKGAYFASEEVGLRGYKTRQLLAEVYIHQNRLLEAELHWRMATAEQVDFEPAWMGLAEIFLRQSRWAELEELLRKLQATPIAPAKLGWLRARGQFLRKDFAAARRTLDGVIDADPQALGPRVLLSHVLLLEGQDWPAAETALRDVLALDANNAEAQHNLTLLLRQQGKMLEVSGNVQ